MTSANTLVALAQGESLPLPPFPVEPAEQNWSPQMEKWVRDLYDYLRRRGDQLTRVNVASTAGLPAFPTDEKYYKLGFDPTTNDAAWHEVGASIYFGTDGSNGDDYFNVGKLGTLGKDILTGAISFEGFILCEVSSPAATYGIFGFSEAAAGLGKFRLFYDGNAKTFIFTADQNGTGYTVTSAVVDMVDGLWHHFWFQWDWGGGGDQALWVDGVQYALTTVTNSSTGTLEWTTAFLADCYVGGVHDLDNTPDALVLDECWLAEFAIYNEAIPLTDPTQAHPSQHNGARHGAKVLYDLMIAATTNPTCLHHWPLNEVSGTTVKDNITGSSSSGTRQTNMVMGEPGPVSG